MVSADIASSFFILPLDEVIGQLHSQAALEAKKKNI